MTCKRVKPERRAEQDYFAGFDDLRRIPSEAQRLEFLRFDSHGGIPPLDNPIYAGKMRHGQTGSILRESRADPWFDAIAPDLVVEYARRQPPYGLRSIIDWLGAANVKRWLTPRQEVPA